MADLRGTKRHARTLTAALSVLSRATLLGLAAVVGLVAGSPSASAQAEKRPSVRLMVPPSAPATPMRDLQEVLVGRLEELGLDVQLSAAPPTLPTAGKQSSEPPDVLAFIWLETLPDLIVVHFYEAAGTNLRERRIPVVDLDAASIEEVAVVVRSAVSALLERSERAAEQDTSPSPAQLSPQARPAPAVVAPDAEPHRQPLRLSVSYVGQDYAPEIRLNHGLALGVAWQDWAEGWSLGASYSWFPALEHRTELLGVTLLRHPAEVSIAWDLPVWQSWLALRPEGAVGADFVVRETSGSSQGLEATARQGRWSWTTSGRLAVVAFPLPRWQLFVAGGASYLLNQFTYTVAGESGAPVITPRRVRPNFSCGVGFELP